MVKDSTQDNSDNKGAVQRNVYDFLIKVVVGGSDCVGKTSLLQRYKCGEYSDAYTATIGIDFLVKDVQTKNGDKVKVQAWDLAGQERFRSITSSYYRGARGMMLVYDVTNKSSFEVIPQHLREVRNMAAEDIVIFLIGNKADLNDSKRQVTYEEGKEFSEEHDLTFFETSARDNVNVDEAFEVFVDRVVEEYKIQRADAAANKKNEKASRKIELKQKEAKTNKKSSTCALL